MRAATPRQQREQLRRMHNGTRRYNGRRYLRILIKLEG